MLQRYVLGFMFTPDLGEVVLVRKNRPAWQAGRVNGVGGKIEPGEEPADAIAREFQEETGVTTAAADWTCFAVMGKADVFSIHVFRMVSDLAINARTVEDEEILRAQVHALPQEIIGNLGWLIPMALDHEIDTALPAAISIT